MPKTITRSTVNEQQYSAPDFQKSGFPLNYKKYSSYILGRTHVSGFQYIMPGDKVSGQNKGNFTMKRLVTPMVAPIEVQQYNVFLPFRAIDRTFERAMAPSKNNNMSQAWETPKVNTRYLVDQILTALIGTANRGSLLTIIENTVLTPNDPIGTTTVNSLYGSTGLVDLAIDSLTNSSGTLYQMADKLYISDALIDVADNIRVKLGSSSNPLSASTTYADLTYLLLDCFLTPWVGRFSYYGEFKYKFLRPWDLYRISRGLGMTIPSSGLQWNRFLLCFDDTPLCEYALRVMYAIWYEKFRNVDLEPVNSNLPDWRDFGSTSIFDISNGGNLCYLLYRIRPWYQDMFTSAQIDDLSRHVWAPVYSTSDTAYYHENDENNLDANEPDVSSINAPKPASYTLRWRDQLDGSNKSITCPVPTNINDILSQNDLSAQDVYGLDLNSLRQTQQLERYLKRNYLFGDEYQDRMLAHYNSRVSDMRINRPEIISQSLNNAKRDQVVSNVSTAESNVGDRTATGTLSAGGDQFTFFAEEFGLLVNVLTFMPMAAYDGICPQVLLSKQVDFPLPEFATNNEEFGRKMEIADSGLNSQAVGSDDSDNRFMFGRYPAYHAWRERVDEVGGDFLDELQDCTFRRFWGMFSDDTTPKLNYYFIHCRPNLGMFANTVVYDSQIYGDVVHECFVERVLPTPVEVI